jgi:hypothetical protein
LKRGVVFGDRRIVLRKRHQRIGAVDARRQMARLAREHAIERRERVLRTIQIEQHGRAVRLRLEMVSRERERLVEARERIGGPLQRAEHQAHVGVRVGRVRGDLQRGGDQPLRLTGLSALQLQQAEQMQRIELVREAFQDAGVALLGRGELTLLVQRHGFLKGRLALLGREFRHAVRPCMIPKSGSRFSDKIMHQTSLIRAECQQSGSARRAP